MIPITLMAEILEERDGVTVLRIDSGFGLPDIRVATEKIIERGHGHR